MTDEDFVEGGKYLILRVARQEFAIDTRCVRGVLPGHDLDPVLGPAPGLAQYFGPWACGFATLRGADIPVIDLGAKLDLPHSARGRKACIVAIEVQTSEGPRMVGFLADRVSGVADVRSRDLENGKLRIRGRWRRVIEPEILVTAV